MTDGSRTTIDRAAVIKATGNTGGEILIETDRDLSVPTREAAAIAHGLIDGAVAIMAGKLVADQLGTGEVTDGADGAQVKNEA
mmetsp:Transcript_1987/g.5938  ORF Transcript_1987/g.5938 Transcript_1987/m.5938 type:complete len:83 (+) Transcript_1987:607-855(+)